METEEAWSDWVEIAGGEVATVTFWIGGVQVSADDWVEIVGMGE